MTVQVLQDVSGLAALAEDASEQGHRMLARLFREWNDGTNRFDRVGERLYSAVDQGRIYGVCGLNQDPFSSDPSIGRIRRLYVASDHRRRGVGSAILARLIVDAASHFRVLHLRTHDAIASSFYRSRGFIPVGDDPNCTHRLVLSFPRVRRAVVQDAQRIAEIHVNSWRVAYQGIMPDAVLDGLSVEKRRLFWTERLLENPAGKLVVEDAGGVMGWLNFGACRDTDAVCDGEVYGIYLEPSACRRGLGRLLWGEACRQLALVGYGRAAVWVLEKNEPARKFYETMGGRIDPGVQKVFEREGARLPEIRYWFSI